MEKRELELAEVCPSARQLKFQQMEFYGFFHFTVNTFSDKEWGDGTESPLIFHPEKLDAESWARAIKKAGMTGAILTCKHHDGFCLWPSKYTDHTIAASPYKEGKGDLVKEVSEALRKEGLKFGVYLSPWDRHEATYGTGEAYNDYYINQLTELLTNYGEVFSVWLDGACGEGKNGKRQIYDWERIYKTVRALQPDACISVCGPDVRWCGNEAGDVRPQEWSVVPERLTRAETVAEKSQQADDDAFREKKITSSELDLGSRQALEGEKKLVWYPAEVDTSIRPGWFYHASEDDRVRSLEELISIYYGAVGGNATLLLNIPPTPEGLIHPADAKRLEEIGEFLRSAFDKNLAEEAVIEASACEEGHEAETIIKDDYEKYFKLPDGCKEGDITFTFREEKEIHHIVLKENIRLSQRMERYQILLEEEDQEKLVYEGTVIGYKKIIPFKDGIRTKKLILRLLEARVAPTLSFAGIYR